MAIEFLGHKLSLLPFIVTTIEKESGGPCDIADLFCGTGAVTSELKRHGYRVIANDHLAWCSTFAEAILINSEDPKFEGVISVDGSCRPPTLMPTPYDTVLEYLNRVEPMEGFIYRNYSPASGRLSGSERMYFTEENAARIDAIRAKIREWQGLVTRGERALLVADLIRAANAVSNIAGTYGCYLKYWKKRALQPLALRPSALVGGSTLGHLVFCRDANQVVNEITASVIYADPPYTKRQHAAYYHILETIALGDEPAVTGSTGLRPWQEKSSDYCYKTKAPQALDDLVSKLKCRHFFLSYNEDGQIPHEVIMAILSKAGRVRTFEAPYRRYKSSSLPHKGNTVLERLYHLAL